LPLPLCPRSSISRLTALALRLFLWSAGSAPWLAVPGLCLSRLFCLPLVFWCSARESQSRVDRWPRSLLPVPSFPLSLSSLSSFSLSLRAASRSLWLCLFPSTPRFLSLSLTLSLSLSPLQLCFAPLLSISVFWLSAPPLCLYLALHLSPLLSVPALSGGRLQRDSLLCQNWREWCQWRSWERRQLRRAWRQRSWE
jgi:hypothetical protein